MQHEHFHIGMRTIKSVISAYLCFVVDYLRGGVGMPFYGAIAALITIQKDMPSSFKTGMNRMIATLNGSIFAAVYLFIEQNFLYLENPLIRYAILSLLMIPVIYFSLLIKQPASTFLSCVVFFSVTINHADGPLEFIITRLTDTGIGVIIALFVNWSLFKVQDLYNSLKAR